MTFDPVRDFALWGFLIRLAYFATTIVVGWYILRFLDRMAGIKFTEALREMHNGNTAVAYYYGFRLLALAVLGQAFL